ncbi:MAG: hypothetical protein IV100_17845 [Myxococcales bacterium]|nr:hypothetical protein [Myxococcales bacterium]
MREQAEALLRLIGEDGVSRIVQGVNRELDGMVGRQRDSARASEEQTRSVLTLGERWSVIATGLNSALELGQKAFALAVQAGEAIADGARGLILDETFAASFLQAAESLDQLREASKGRIADNVLEQIAIDAQRAGLSLEATGTLLAATTKAAAITGKPAADAMKELAKSIAEGTNEGFKQLGVFFDANAVLETYAKTLGKTTGELTQADKSAALLATGVEQLNTKFDGVVGDAALSKVQRLGAGWNNVKDTVLEFLAADAGRAFEHIENAWNDTSGQSATFEQRLRSQVKTLDDVIERSRALGQIASLGFVDLGQATREAQALQDLAREYGEVAKAAAVAAGTRAGMVRAYGGEERLALVESMQALKANADEALRLAGTRAELAGAFLDSASSTREWTAWTRAADEAQLDLLSSTGAMTQALSVHRNEMVRTLALQAEMAELAGDAAGAAAARSQAASLATGDRGVRDVAGAGGSSGGGGSKGPRRDDAYYARLASDASKAYESQLRAGAEAIERIQADAAFGALERQNDLDELALNALVTRHERELQLEQEHQAALVVARQGGFDAAAEASRNLVGALGELDGFEMSNLPNTISQFGPLLEKIEALRDGTDKSQNAMTKGAAGIVSASGKMVAGLIKNETARAAIMVLVEAAEATRSFASYDYVGGALHVVAAAQYAAVAGMSAAGGGGGRGGGSRGRGAPELPASMQPKAETTAPAPIAYNVYMSGSTVIGGDETALGRSIARAMHDHDRRTTTGGAARAGAPR